MKSEREQERERERMDELLFDLVHNHLRPGEGRIVFVSVEIKINNFELNTHTHTTTKNRQNNLILMPRNYY